MTEDERAIRKVVETWMNATKSGDLATILSLMTDDVVFMVRGRSRSAGGFAARFKGMEGVQIEGTSKCWK